VNKEKILDFWTVFSKAEKKWIALLLIVIVTTSLLELIGLILVVPYIELMFGNTQSSDYLSDYPLLYQVYNQISYNDKLSVSVWFALFYVIKNILLSVLFFLEQNIIKNIKFNIMSRSFTYYMRQSYSFHIMRNSSKTIRSITYDITVFVGSIKKGSMLISELLLFAGVLGIMAWKSPVVILLFMALVMPLILIYTLMKKKLKFWGEQIQGCESNIILNLQEGINGIKNIIIFGVHNFFIRKFRKNVKEQVRIKRNLDMAITIPRYIIEALMMIVFSIVLYWATESGGLKENLSFMAFIAISSVRILPMSNRILSAISGIKSSAPSIDIVKKIAKPVVNNTKNSNYKSHDASDKFLSLRVNGLSFQYQNFHTVLNNFSFEISRGESIGIVGESGSGKTTLIDILLGLYPPTKGSVYCNDIMIKDDLEQWRGRVGYVSQDVFLSDGTIKENIAFGIPVDKIDINKIKKIIKEVRLDSWVSEFSKGLNTAVGERGVRISGGQRQRIGIARALYSNPEVLILDEATSALDNNTERKIMNDIYSLKKDRTIIIIAHRLNTIRECDRILVLNKGHLVGNDTYENLSKFNKVFQNIGLVKGS
jgi:ABC-type multidrug transport system fused ATPase/permease subunit